MYRSDHLTTRRASPPAISDSQAAGPGQLPRDVTGASADLHDIDASSPLAENGTDAVRLGV